MSADFGPGTVHGGWRVTGPALEGAHDRYPVERDGRAATLTAFPLTGPRAELHRAIADRHAAWRAVQHEALERVDTGKAEAAAYVVTPQYERLGEAPLDAAAALGALERVARALAAFHAAGVAHGEVDAWSLVKRSDGFALLPPGLRPPPQGLETLSLLVDPRYASPEALDGRPPSPEGDVFSLGMLLFRMVTGQPPAQGADPVETLVARGAIPAPDLASAKLPPSVVSLYANLVAPIGLRPKDAMAALTLIEQAARGKTLAPPQRVYKPLREARVAGPLILLLALVGGGWALWTMLNTRLAPASPFEGFRFRTTPEQR